MMEKLFTFGSDLSDLNLSKHYDTVCLFVGAQQKL
jgi:hypothetical protein